MSLFGRVVDALLLRGGVDTTASVSVRQFVGSGVTTAVDVGVFYCLYRSGLTGVLAAAALSFCVALVMNYCIASAWVFRHLAGKTLWHGGRFLRYAACALVSLGLNQLIIWAVSIRAGFPPLAGKSLAIVLLFFWNQWVARKVIFNGQDG